METLYDARTYPESILTMIWRSGSLGIAIANWWMLGWPERVRKLLEQRIYEDEFQHHLSQMQEILARTHGQFFAGGDCHNVGSQPRATKFVEVSLTASVHRDVLLYLPLYLLALDESRPSAPL